MSTQVVANAVSSFLSSAKGMEVQSAETTEGYVAVSYTHLTLPTIA